MHCTSRALLTHAFRIALQRSSALPPSFLIPSFITTQSSEFSSCSILNARKDGNPHRGVSAIRRTGLNRKQEGGLSVKVENLPKPVLEPWRRSEPNVDDNHGLWEFFYDERDAIATPMKLAAYGRPWTVPELRNKDWDDLWRLWWVCIKEGNKIVTFKSELKRLSDRGGNMYGASEADGRMEEIKRTRKAIKHVLTERWYAWENARFAAMEDPEVNLYADPDKGEPAYLPRPETDEEKFEAA